MMIIQDLAKPGHDPKFEMAHIVKPIQRTSSPEPLVRFG